MYIKQVTGVSLGEDSQRVSLNLICPEGLNLLFYVARKKVFITCVI